MTTLDKTIIADDGMIFRRIHDGFEMGKNIALGMDFSTGEERVDLPQYYEEITEKSDLIE